jgi:phospholipase C
MNNHRRNVLTFLATRIGISGFVIVALMALMAPQVFASVNNGGDSHIGSFKHVFIIMMENTGYDTLIGNPNAPWINKAAKKYGLATNYYGVTHPSQPNYIAATSGSLNGVTSDSPTTVDVPNVVDQLEAHDKPWKAYMQSYSLCTTPLDAVCGNALYERKHNPFISYQDVQSNPSRVANIVDFSQFQTDLDRNHVPAYSWISPDQCHDMHGRGGPSTDPCNYGNVQGLISAGDAFLHSTVDAIMDSRAWSGNSVIFITWDESDYTGSGFQGFGDDSGCCDSPPNQGGGHVLTLVISHSQEDHVVSNIAYNHYSILSTIEASWRLGCLGFACDKANVPNMQKLVED